MCNGGLRCDSRRNDMGPVRVEGTGHFHPQSTRQDTIGQRTEVRTGGVHGKPAQGKIGPVERIHDPLQLHHTHTRQEVLLLLYARCPQAPLRVLEPGYFHQVTGLDAVITQTLEDAAGALHDHLQAQYLQQHAVSILVAGDRLHGPPHCRVKDDAGGGTGGAVSVDLTDDQNHHANAQGLLADALAIHQDLRAAGIELNAIDEYAAKPVNSAGRGQSRTADTAAATATARELDTAAGAPAAATRQPCQQQDGKIQQSSIHHCFSPGTPGYRCSRYPLPHNRALPSGPRCRATRVA